MGSVKKTIELQITRDVDYGFGAAPEKMRIRIASISPDYLDEVLRANPDASEHRAKAIAIAGMVSEWELEGPVPMADTGLLKEGEIVPEGQRIPIDPDVIEKLPAPVVSGLVAGIWAAATPKRGGADQREVPAPAE
jgi:hypothetical protein